MGDGASWTARDGRRVRVADMTDSHLLNAIEFVRGRYRALLAEQARRGLPADPRLRLRAARRLARVDSSALERFAGLDLPDGAGEEDEGGKT